MPSRRSAGKSEHSIRTRLLSSSALIFASDGNRGVLVDEDDVPSNSSDDDDASVPLVLMNFALLLGDLVGSDC